MSKVSRRGMIQGLIAGAAVFGFDPQLRAWVSEAKASPSFAHVPPLDGLLTTDPATCATYADDFGHVVHRTPVAVLLPGSVNDVVAMVKFARTHGVRIAGRGKGHTAFGQSQADAGLVIDMTTLDTIHSIDCGRAVVDAGVVWRDLLLETTAQGLTPPVVTNFFGLTVGGTLSVGGVSGASFRYGAQVDNVLELQVVTGEGQLVTCSPSHHSDLFEAALGGLGLCGMIVRVTLRLVPAEDSVRTFRIFYPDVPSMTHDMRILVARNKDAHCDDGPRIDHIQGYAAPAPTPPGWGYFIEATSYYSAPEDPDAGDLLSGLGYIPGSLQVEDHTYFEFLDAVYQLIEFLKVVGLFALPHLWLDLFVPGSKIDAFATQTLGNLNSADFLPPGLVLFYPFVRNRLSLPLLRVPNESFFVLFDILRSTPPDPSVVSSVLQLNRTLYDQNLALGGTHYTIAAVQLSSQDWKKHFQPSWGALNSAKHHYDPDNVLGAGLNVFP